MPSRARGSPFDNIAIASTVYSDLWERTWRTAESEIIALRSELGESFFGLNDRLDRLYFDFNTRFLLNPAADASAEAKSSLDIVTERQPERLLVSIGGNNGLWQFGYLAEPWRGQDDPSGPFNRQDFADLETLFDKLAISGRGAAHLRQRPAASEPHRQPHALSGHDGLDQAGPDSLYPFTRTASAKATAGSRPLSSATRTPWWRSERADASARPGLGSHPHRAGGPPVRAVRLQDRPERRGGDQARRQGPSPT